MNFADVRRGLYEIETRLGVKPRSAVISYPTFEALMFHAPHWYMSTSRGPGIGNYINIDGCRCELDPEATEAIRYWPSTEEELVLMRVLES